MQFLSNIKSSIYNPAHYSEILNKPFSYSLRYFLSLAVLIAIVSTIVFSVNTLPEMNKVIGEVDANVLKFYPDDLEITIKNGIVSTNVPEPYFIKMPAEFKSEFQDSNNSPARTSPDLSKIKNMFVIDTASPLTIDLFKSYKTFVLISRDSIAYFDNNAVKIQSLGQEANGVINKAKVSTVLNEIMPYIKIIPVASIPIVLFFSFIGFIFGNMIYLIFGAFVIWLFAQLAKRNWSYGKSYQIGLHAITLSVILEATIFQLYPILEFPFLFTILMFAIVWVNFKNSPITVDAPPVPKVPEEKIA